MLENKKVKYMSTNLPPKEPMIKCCETKYCSSFREISPKGEMISLIFSQVFWDVEIISRVN
jgi:hypothetical protein